jgi:hypothetical protein
MLEARDPPTGDQGSNTAALAMARPTAKIWGKLIQTANHDIESANAPGSGPAVQND